MESGRYNWLAGTYEYKFTVGNWVLQETVPGECSLDPEAANINRAVTITDTGITAPVTAYSGCADTSLGVTGDWRIAPPAAALGVGPTKGDIGWWSNSADDVNIRYCLFDDVFGFNSDGSFSNSMGGLTWLETWQDGSEGCGAPVAPHDGSNPATYVYDASVGTLTVSGEGAHIGLTKVVNGGEVSNGAPVPASITYEVSELTDSSMTVDINYSDGYWRFKMVTADSVAAPAPTFGCNDENATNYDASADVDDGSCLYEVAASVASDGSAFYWALWVLIHLRVISVGGQTLQKM